MARKRVVEAIPVLNNWDDVNEALRVIGTAQRHIERIEHGLQEKVDALKADAAACAKSHQDTIAAYEKQLMQFAEANRADFGKSKSKQLNFGIVSFRKSSRIKLPKDEAQKAEIIRRLRERQMLDCIKKAKATIDKEALKRYGELTVSDVGAELITEETFGYEIDRERLLSAEG